MVDRHGNFLEKYQQVEVPNPKSDKTDLHQHSFVGTVIDVLESRGTAIVEDQCSDVFEIEANRLIIQD